MIIDGLCCTQHCGIICDENCIIETAQFDDNHVIYLS